MIALIKDESAQGQLLVLVEDDEAVRNVLTVLLEAAGWEVLSAGDGRSGLELATQTKPDVVVTDLRMPGLSGIELAKRLGDSPEVSSVPVLAITSDGSRLREAAIRSRCFHDVLEKPLAPDTLLKAVSEAAQQQPYDDH